MTTHIRPTKRSISRPSNKANLKTTTPSIVSSRQQGEEKEATNENCGDFNLDELLERTRVRMAKALNTGSTTISTSTQTSFVKGISSKDKVSNNARATSRAAAAAVLDNPATMLQKYAENDRNKNNKIRISEKEMMPNQSKSKTQQSQHPLKSILKHGTKKYSKGDDEKVKTHSGGKVKEQHKQKQEMYQKERSKMEKATLAEEMGILDNNIHNLQGKEEEDLAQKTVLQDFVVERSNPTPDYYPNEQQQYENNHDSEPVAIDEGNEIKESPKTDEDEKSEDPTEIETDLEFSAMSVEEYEETVKTAQSMGLSFEEYYKKQQEDGKQKDDSGKNIINVDGNQGKGQKNDDIINSENEEDDDDGDFLSFFAQDDDEDEGDKAPIPPSSFLILYNALIEWMTRDAVQILRKWNEATAITNGSDTEENEVNSDAISGGESANANVNDVYNSRCTGLMATLKLHMSTALSELECDTNINGSTYTRQQIESRLGEWVQTFDFAQPMVKMNSDLWVGMTIILLEVILPLVRSDMESISDSAEDEPIENSDLGDDNLPMTIKKIGLKKEEYSYLTGSLLDSIYEDI